MRTRFRAIRYNVPCCQRRIRSASSPMRGTEGYLLNARTVRFDERVVSNAGYNSGMTPQTFVVGHRDADQTVTAFFPPGSTCRGRRPSGSSNPARSASPGKRSPTRPNGSSSASTSRWSLRARWQGSEADSGQVEGGPAVRRPEPALVYSDDSIAVVDKPPGLTTMRHAEEAAEFGERGKKYLPVTLADLLPAMLGRPGKAVRAVHRIDRDTSGLVVFARSRSRPKST